jgi:hypothetical protein
MSDSSHMNRRLRLDVPLVALVLAAAAPFVPLAWQFIQHGVPDYLFTGDGAALELRTLHASRGEQFLGPYSRFVWSHPGPLFFYLALPVYEAAGQRGPALNLFVLLANLAVAIAIVLSARRLRGNSFAWLVAGLLAVLALPFVRAGEWNPASPILSLLLLSLLGARLALGDFRVMPAFAFIASVIVQTHVGFLPEVLVVTGFAGGWAALRFWLLQPSTPPRPGRGVSIATAVVLLVCWALPLYESATNAPGNMRLLVDFFSESNPNPPPWDVVFTHLFTQLTALPIALARAFYASVPVPHVMLSEAIAILLTVVVVAAAIWAWQRRDSTLGVLAGIALAETVVAVAAVRGIRGEVLPYLVWWIAVPGFMLAATVAAWIAREGPRWHAAAAAIGVVLVALALASPGAGEPAFRRRSEAAEQFARDLEHVLTARGIEAPVVRIASGNVWPTAAGVILYLHKREVPFYVEPSWAFMFGRSLVDPGGDRPRVLVGGRGLAEQARTDALLSPLAGSGEVVAYFEAAGALDHRRIHPPPKMTTFVEMERDPKVAVDGDIPLDGTSWDSPRSAIFRSTASSLTVDVPHVDIAVSGLYASIDGGDLYTVRCDEGGPSWDLGSALPEERLAGMQTRRILSDRLAGCRTVTIAPKSGDGLYSIAEIGFLR